MSPLGSVAWLGSPGSLGSSDPFGGVTGFGFDIPQGDPGAIASAAHGLRRLGTALEDQGREIAAASRAVLGTGGWGGWAANAYADYSGQLLGVCSTNASALAGTASVLHSFSRELGHAQSITRQALADCERAGRDLTAQQANASKASQDAAVASQNAAIAPHPLKGDFCVRRMTPSSSRRPR